jgi:cell division protein FtsQ
VTPSNRRLKKPVAPPDVMESASPPGPLLATETPRPSRLMVIAKDAGGLALVVATSVGVAWGAERYVTQSPRFAIADVVVDGNHLRTRDDVLARAELRTGDNVFLADLDSAQAKLERDPWIAEATLARRLPDTILVSVHEREARAIVSLDGDAYLSTKDGELFKKLEAGDPVDLPVVTGITADTVSKDREGVARSIVRSLDLASDYEHSTLGQKQSLEEIHLSPAGGVTLVIGKGATQLVLGGPPYRKKLEEASRAIAEIERRGSKADAIFLDNDARPERVVARVK